MANELARLFVVIGAKTTDLERSLAKTQQSVKQLGILMTAVGTAVTASLAAMTVKWAQAGDQVAKLSEKTGFSAETLSELRYAAELSGTSVESLAVAIRRMQVAITEAGRESSTTARYLGYLGLSYQELATLSPDKQFELIAARLADLEDPTLKAAVATAIFGRSGTDLLPMLAQGSEGLERMRSEAQRLGIVFTAEGAKKAEAFRNSMTQLRAAISGLTANIGEALAPIITKFALAISSVIEKVTAWAKSHPQLTKALSTLVLTLGVATGAMGTFILVQQAWIRIAPLVGMAFHAALGPIGLVTLAISGVVAGVTLLIDKIKSPAKRAMEDFNRSVKDLGDSIINELGTALNNLSNQVTNTAEDVASAIKKQQDAIENLISFVKGIETEGMELVPEEFIGIVRQIYPEFAAQLEAINEDIKMVRGQYDQLDETLRKQRIAEIQVKLGKVIWEGQPVTEEERMRLLDELAGLLSKEWKALVKKNAPNLLDMLEKQKVDLKAGLKEQRDIWQQHFDEIKKGWDGTYEHFLKIIDLMNQAVEEGIITKEFGERIKKQFEDSLREYEESRPRYTEESPVTHMATPERPFSVIDIEDLLRAMKKGQHGLFVTRPTLALLGEGGPEVALPTSLLASVSNRKELHVHIGSYLGDDVSLRKLVRELKQFIQEDDRRSTFGQLNKGWYYGRSAI